MFKFIKRVVTSSKQENVDAKETKKLEGWYTPHSASELLDNPLRQKLISLIWQRVSMDKNRFGKLYLQAINNYVEIVQLLPASESHHHSYLGGMIDHGLEVINYALKLRQPYLLPIGANPEDIPKQAEAWSAAVMYGALLHDIGKVVVDIHIEMNNGQTWYPWAENIHLPYRFNYNQKRDYTLHPSAAALMLHRIVPKDGLTWLSQFPDLFPLFLNLSTGHNEKAGVLAEIIQKADMSSVSNNLGGDPTKALAKPVQSLMSKMIKSIRYLVSSELNINGIRGSDCWFDGLDLWVVSKTFTDKMRANLLQNGITEVPSDNAKIFDILKEHKIAITNSEDKTIWTCKVESDCGWVAEKLTLIRIPGNVAYSNITSAPETFKGKIIVLDNNLGKIQPSVSVPIAVDIEAVHSTKTDSLSHNEQMTQVDISNPENHSTDVNKHSNNSLNDAVLNLFSNDEMAISDEDDESHQEPEENRCNNEVEGSLAANKKSEEENRIIHQDILQSDPVTTQVVSSLVKDIYNQPFLKWIRSQILEKKLPINNQNACIHTVEDKIFLVTPKIFKKYSLYLHGNDDDSNWKKYQSEFQSLKIHQKFSEENFNIWKCLISGKRKNNTFIKGYLIENKQLFAIEETFLNNPHLTLIHDINIYKNS